MIITRDLTKRFGDFTAVNRVNIKVKAGEILAILGPNGAGKTTTIRMLASILKPTSGQVVVSGYDSVSHSQEIRRLTGLLTEHHGLYTRMKAHDYLRFFGQSYGMGADQIRARAEMLLERYGLGEAVDLRLGQYSKGMRQKLALVRALLHDPSVLLLDEPTSAMDPSSAHLVRNSIDDLRRSDRAIIVCTHNLFEAEALADWIAIIRRGEIIAMDSTDQLKRRLLGNPVMELRVASALDGVLDLMPEGVRTLASGVNWIRYEVEDPGRINPIVIRTMIEAGIPIVTLAEVERSLEDLYLRVVENGRGEVVR
ncbi:MAG: ABC transporter ATP-binding protein [Anaerolineales bacterium]|nr:ABC transporter ATP-binding protein [Anaerolineales bacterium]